MDELFEHTTIRRAYVQLAIPVVLSMTVTIVYNLVDTFFVSKTQNPNLVAGVSQGAPMFTLMLAIGDIFGLGGASVISRLFGEKKDDVAKNVSGFCFWTSIFTGLIVTVLLFIFQTPMLHVLGATPATWKYARQYYLVIAAGSTFIINGLTPTNILRAEGLAMQSSLSTIVGTVINIFLNPLFIFGFGLGAAGSALATVVGNIIADLMMIYYTNHVSKKLTTSIHHIKISGKLIREVLVIGIPASITNLMGTFAVALTNNYLVKYGAASVAAMGIAMKVSMIANVVMVGFAYGGQPLIGYTYGAKNQRRFTATIRFGLATIFFASLAVTILLEILAPDIIRLFMKDPEVVSRGAVMIRWLASSAAFAGVVLIFTTSFQSMGKPIPAFLMSLCRQGIIFAACMAILSNLFGYTGILAAQAMSDTLTMILGAILMIKNWPHFAREKD